MDGTIPLTRAPARWARRLAGPSSVLVAVAVTSCGPRGCSSHSRSHPKKVPPTETAEGSATTIEGHFGWHDLVTTDTVAAAAFYADVVGWRTSTDGSGYTICADDVAPLAGISKLAPEANGVAPFWAGSVVVADVNAVARASRDLGGKVYVEPKDLPTSRFAALGDPRGPVVNVMHPRVVVNLRDPTHAGEFFWNQLETTDVDGALAFYGKLFGWTSLREDRSPGVGRYVTCGIDDDATMALHSAARDIWLMYIQVSGLDAALARATARGAHVLTQPVTSHDGRMATLLDPQGALFALHEGTPK